MDARLEYSRWRDKLKDDGVINNELVSLSERESEIIGCFGNNLSFGTAGARGILGIGPSRMNSVTVAHISSAYSDYLKKKFTTPSVVVSYDTRKYSDKFAQISSEVFAANGIFVYIFDTPNPIGVLSYAIRSLKCSGGVMITASHNPPEYNGYKIYNQHGAQPVDVSEISEILKSKDIFDFRRYNFDDALRDKKILFVEEKIKDDYVDYIQKVSQIKSVKNVNITYSPLHGCACDLFCRVFNSFKNLSIVEQQKHKDENFSTCPRPDPQNLDSFFLSFELAKKKNSDIIILNDPDGDRLGIALKSRNNSYKVLTGLEIAALFLNFIVETNKSKNNIIIIKSIVSGGLCDTMTDFYEIRCEQTLPGFKYVSENILNLEQKGNLGSFVLGFEESNGFLLMTDIRDKDGISSSAFFCKMISYYKEKNLDCIDILDSLYKKFGYHMQKNISIKEADKSKISQLIDKFKIFFINKKQEVSYIKDYRNLEIFDVNLNKIIQTKAEKSDILEVSFKNKSKLFVRSSGTEPLIKFYIMYSGRTEHEALNQCTEIENLILNIYNK